MRLREVAKVKIPNVKMKSGFDIELKPDPFNDTEEYYEVTYNGKPIGDIRNKGGADHPDFEVLHYDTDLGWDMIDTLSDAYEVIKDTHREYKGGKLKESTALSQQYGGKRAKVLSYSQAVRWLAKDYPANYLGEGTDNTGFDKAANAIATIYGRDRKEVMRDAQHAYNAMLAKK